MENEPVTEQDLQEPTFGSRLVYFAAERTLTGLIAAAMVVFLIAVTD